MKKLGQEEVREIYKAYASFNSLRKVSKIFGRSVSTIRKYANVKAKNIVRSVKTNDELLMGLYVGLWLGDGTQYIDRYGQTVKICSNKNDKLLNKFICDLMYKLFGKSVNLIEEKNTNRAYVRFHSKFIFDYIYNYVKLNGHKTYSVKLKGDLRSFTDKFLKGCLLGLALSDGSLRGRFTFGVASEGLASNMKEILLRFQFNPYVRIENRPNKATFYVVALTAKESRLLQEFLSSIIHDTGDDYSFNELKYGPDLTF